MALPVIFPEIPTPYFDTQLPSSMAWRHQCPRYHFYWKMGDAEPAPFTHSMEFPAYDILPGGNLYSNYRLVITFLNVGTSGICRVNGQTSLITTELGVPFNNGGPFYRKELNFSFAQLNLLAEGSYTTGIIMRVLATDSITGENVQVATKNITLQFYVSATQFQQHSPFQMEWNERVTGPNGPFGLQITHYKNSPLPAAVDLYFFRHKNATLAPALTSSDIAVLGSFVAVHDYFSKVQVALNGIVENFEVGEYQFTIDLQYPPESGEPVGALIDINLTILNPDDDSLILDPEEVTFEVIVGGPQPIPKTVALLADASWAITSLVPAWLDVSHLSGSGNATVTLTPQNFEGMAAASYVAFLHITNGNVTKSLRVNLNLQVFATHPFFPGELFFTRDLDYLSFSSATANTYIQLELRIRVFGINTFAEREYIRLYNFPLFQGRGKFHIGSIAHTLLEEISEMTDYAPSATSNYFKAQAQPVKIEISYQEKSYDIDSDDSLVSGTIQEFKMLKGNRPFMTASGLALLTVAQQEVTRITPNSVISTSFRKNGPILLQYLINNVIEEELIVSAFPSNGVDKEVFSYYRFVNELRRGDMVEIRTLSDNESRSQRFMVFPRGLESTFFFFQNANGQMESFEFTGRRRISSNYQHIAATEFKDLFSRERKVKSDNKQTMTVNTGQVSPIEQKVVDALIKSETLWCSLDDAKGPYFRVNATSSKLSNQDTSTTDLDFDVEFNILENANVTLYPF